jgi:hypothetical protein
MIQGRLPLVSGIPWNILPPDPNRTADISPSAEPIMISTTSEATPISPSAEVLYRMSEVELLTAYAEARRQFVEKKFTRDTHRARLE